MLAIVYLIYVQLSLSFPSNISTEQTRIGPKFPLGYRLLVMPCGLLCKASGLRASHPLEQISCGCAQEVIK
jgi:hypothetical protein